MKASSKSIRPISRGFTLVEMLVVLTLVSIISLGSYALLENFMVTDRLLDTRAEHLRRLSMALYRMEDDFRQVTARAIKNGYTGYEPALRGDSDEIEFTRLGAANLMREPRGDLQRLGYSLGFSEDNDDDPLLDGQDQGALLLRTRWQVLDRGPDSEPLSEPMLSGIDSMVLRYFDREAETWLAQWPPVSSGLASGSSSADTRLPGAVEMVLTLSGGTEIRRVFNFPHAISFDGSTSGAGRQPGNGGDENEGEREEGEDVQPQRSANGVGR